MKYIYLSIVLLLQCAGYMHAQTPAITLSSPVVVDNSTLTGSLRPRIALSTGDVPVVIWGKASPGAVFSSRLTGGTFSSPIQILPAQYGSVYEYW